MVAFAHNPDPNEWFEMCRVQFAGLLPLIREEANSVLRDLPAQQRVELVEQVVRQAFSTFLNLAERGKIEIAYPKPLTMVAVKQLHARQVALGPE